MSFFISAIGTEVGKTVTSAILVEALQADYWKPVQCGDLDWSDSKKIQSWTSNDQTIIHKEQFKLRRPMSPHAAAAKEGVEIQLSDFTLPTTTNTLIVEGAGGLEVPLNDHDLMSDLIVLLNLPLILVVRHYLGNINHTLLSLSLIKHKRIPFAGILFNGTPNVDTENVITKHIGADNILGRIPELPFIDRQIVTKVAQQVKNEIIGKSNIFDQSPK